VVTKKPEAASLPSEPVLEAPKEPAKQPAVARKKQMLPVEKAIAEEDTRSLQEAEAPSSPLMLPALKKKATKRGLLSGKPAALKTFDFDDEETEDEVETGAEDTTKDTVDEVVSRMLDDTIELDLASTQEDVDMIDAQEVTRVLAEVEGITQMDDTGEPEPEPTKTKKAAKPHKVLTPEPAPAPVVQKKAGKSRKAATPEPQSEAEEGDEDELEEFDPILLKKRRKQALIKKPAPTKAKKAAPEPKSISADNENDEEGENVQPKKRAGKQPPAKKAAAKKALETESETEQEEEEDGLESRVLSKRGGKQVTKKIAPGKKSAPAKGKKAQQPEPESESEAEPEPQPEEGDDTEGEEEESVPVPKKRGGKQAPAKKPTAAKSARVTKKAPEPEPEPESEVDADETEVEEVEEPIQPRKRGGKQTQPEKAKPEQPAKPARKNAKKATSPIPEEPAPEPEPEKPVVKGKGRGKGKAVAPLSPPTKKKSVKTSKIAADDDVEMGEASGTSQTNKKSVPALPKGRRKKVPQVEDVTEPVLQEAEGEEGDVEEPPKKKSRGAAKPKTTRLVKSIVSSQAPRSATKRPAKAPKSRKPPPSQEAEPAEDVQEDEAEEEAPRSRKGKAPATKKPAAKKPTATEKGKGKAREESTSLSEEIKGTQRVILEKLPAPPPRDESVDAEGKRRSNRRRLAPLQYWKGEKVEYRIEAEGEEAAPRPEMVVIRVESDEEDKKKTKRAARKRTGSAAPAAAGKKRKRTISKDEADEGESDPGEPEPWEQGIGLSEDDVGIKRGMIRSFPPYADSEGEDILEECHLAYTKERIVTVDVANGAFKFVKTFTQDGFGTGIIEVPPGGGKRVKNSGKMTLVFYMLLGRATVTIGDNRFRVGKGGQFMVPRGITPFSLFTLQVIDSMQVTSIASKTSSTQTQRCSLHRDGICSQNR